jgi:L-fuconolactonase
MAESDESIVGHVGYVDPTSNAFSTELSRFASNPLFRGIRARGLPVRKLLQEQSNLSALAELDLSLDLLARPADLTAVAELARSIPSLRIVLDHVAHVPIDGREPAADWSAGMRELSALRNVFCKVSGLTEAAVERPAPTDPAYYAPTLEVLFEELGAERLMYASNWPVCELASDYETGYRVVDSFLAARPATERELVEWRTAKAAYKYVGVNDGR